jgi:hypothetical protein
MLHPHVDPEKPRSEPVDIPRAPHLFSKRARDAWPPTRQGWIALGGLAIILAAVIGLALQLKKEGVTSCNDEASLALVRSIQSSGQNWMADEYMAASPLRESGRRVFVWIANGPNAVGIHSGYSAQVSPDEGNLSSVCRVAIWDALAPVLQRRDQGTRDRVANSLR